MRSDSSGTRTRILAAARAEFAEFGLAGARVDRIAEAAAANKRLIYVYFGSKEALFDTVIERCLASAAEAVPFDPVDVTGYAAALFDYLVAYPETMRLTTWNQLERGENTEASLEVYRGMVRALRAAQRRGQANAGLDPVDLIALVQALARAWFVASPALRGAGTDDPWSPARLAKHRAAVVQAVASVVGAERTGEPLRRARSRGIADSPGKR